MGLWHINGSPNLGQKTRPNNNQQKKRTWKIVDFAVPADHRIKLKECEKKEKYLDLARELKKLWNMQVTIIPIVIGAFGTVTKGLLKGLEDLEVGGRVEIIQTTALLRMTRIPRRVLETWVTCCHSNSSERPSAKTDVKNSQGVNNYNVKSKFISDLSSSLRRADSTNSFDSLALEKASRRHPVSAQNWIGQTMVCPCEVVHCRTLLLSSSLLHH